MLHPRGQSGFSSGLSPAQSGSVRFNAYWNDTPRCIRPWLEDCKLTAVEGPPWRREHDLKFQSLAVGSSQIAIEGSWRSLLALWGACGLLGKILPGLNAGVTKPNSFETLQSQCQSSPVACVLGRPLAGCLDFSLLCFHGLSNIGAKSLAFWRGPEDG